MGFHLFHSWGEWTSAAEPCVFVRKCMKPGCTKLQQRIEHTFGDWQYRGNGSCTQERVCAVCGKVEERNASHQFGEWEYIQSDSCRQFRKCSRCNEKEFADAEHKFGAWQYHTENSCEVRRSCSHCGFTEYRIEHEPDEGPSDGSDCQIDTRCNRCGQLLRSEIKHTWSDQMLPYKRCLENAIGYQERKGQKLEELIRQYELNPTNPQYTKLRIAKMNATLQSQGYWDVLDTLQEDGVATYCETCKMPRYLGDRERRTKQIRGFLSYCWSEMEYADRIDSALRKSGYVITRDIRDLDVGTKLHEFMDRVQFSKYVIVLISDRYLRSKNCMYEATKVVTGLSKKSCVVLPISIGLDLSDKTMWEDYIRYWNDKRERALADHLPAGEIAVYSSILESITEFLTAMVERKYEQIASLADVDDLLLQRLISQVDTIYKS